MIIEEAEGGATFHAETDGGEESCVARIIIGNAVATTKELEKSSALWDLVLKQQYLVTQPSCASV